MGDGGENLEDQIRSVEEQIQSVEEEIRRVEEQINRCPSDEERKLLREEKAQLRGEKAQLRGERAQLLQGQGSLGVPDNSHKWIKYMSAVKPELPRNEADLTRVLFPARHGKLPVTKETYVSLTMARRERPSAMEYLEVADGSEVPVVVTHALLTKFPAAFSEMATTASISSQFNWFFTMFTDYSDLRLSHNLLLNCNERTGYSFSKTTKPRSRPDTLCIASGRTLLVGEEKFRVLWEAEQDLRNKVKPLPTLIYGELGFILGYIAAGTRFQWVYLGRNGGDGLRLISPCLDLAVFQDRCKFCLSLGYSYHLLCTMADSMPEVKSEHAMFSRDIKGDRTIDFLPDCVRKSVKNFGRYCKSVGTTMGAVKKAYAVARGCPSLPQLIRDKVKSKGTYSVEYTPVGYPPILRSEQDLRNMARCVCEALHVLHTNGLVHRDIRPPNILQVSQDQFILIDLEAVAEIPNKLPAGFSLNGWSVVTLEGGFYSPMSDMHQLGQLLASKGVMVDTMPGQAFIHQLTAKQLSAELALQHPWLSNAKDSAEISEEEHNMEMKWFQVHTERVEDECFQRLGGLVRGESIVLNFDDAWVHLSSEVGLME